MLALATLTPTLSRKREWGLAKERGKMDEALKTVGDKVAGALPGAVTGVHAAFGELTLLAEPARIVDVLIFLRDDPACQFVCFTDICGADYPEREKRFDVVYQLLSPKLNLRVRVKVQTDEGHPLRKDFPMTGFVEVRYDDEEKRVVYEPVRLNQEFRQFDFMSPWEGAGPLPGDEKAKQP
jgi:NADH-quinone oxidoreductase subunit C